MFEALAVGGVYPKAVGALEGLYFDIGYPQMELIYNVHNPTERELSQVTQGSDFEIRAIELNDVVFITTKFGGLHWAEAPYNPSLGDGRLDEIEPGTRGYALQFYLTDAPDGIIRHMRLIGLGNEFSIKLRELIYANKEKVLTIAPELYEKKREDVFQRYKTSEIAKMSPYCYRIRKDEAAFPCATSSRMDT